MWLKESAENTNLPLAQEEASRQLLQLGNRWTVIARALKLMYYVTDEELVDIKNSLEADITRYTMLLNS